MVKYIKQKQQQKQQLQSLLPPELATLDTPLGGLRIIKGGATFIKALRVSVEFAVRSLPWATVARASETFNKR